MKRNGMCPICFVKRFFNVPSKVSEVYPADFYGNGAGTLSGIALTKILFTTPPSR